MTLKVLRIKVSVFLVFILCSCPVYGADDRQEKEEWQVHPKFEEFKPRVIAVLPMDNLSLEPGVENALFDEVYQRLIAKGYSRIKVERVREVMKELGIQTPGQLAGISLQRLGKKLGCDAVLRGEMNQSADVHSGVYDAVVVSCSLRLIDCTSSHILWQTEQWRTAHRQWQVDPLNMLLNFFAHKGSSREKRIAFLVEEMLKTLPQGAIQVIVGDDLLDKATEIKVK